MERDKYKLTEEQIKIFDEYKKTVPFTIYKQFYALSKVINPLELENAGYLGLVYAIQNYNDSRGCSMKTYVINNVRYAVLRYLKELRLKKNIQLCYISTVEMEEYERSGVKTENCRFTLASDMSATEDRIAEEQVLSQINAIAKEILPDKYYEVYKRIYVDGESVIDCANGVGVTRHRVYQINQKITTKLRMVCRERGIL